MLESLLIKNASLVLPEGVREGDIFIKDGVIQDIGPSLSVSAELEINDRGLTVLPGMIDTHVHFREPGATHKETIGSDLELPCLVVLRLFLKCLTPVLRQLHLSVLLKKIDCSGNILSQLCVLHWCNSG